MKIKSAIEKIPGGMMVIPLIAGAIINTAFPKILQIGGFTTAIATCAATIIGVILFYMGAGMDAKAAPKALKTGFVLTVVKNGIGVGIGLAVAKFFGADGLWGLSSLAVSLNWQPTATLISSYEDINGVNVFPNPSKGFHYIKFSKRIAECKTYSF